jgi:predicted transposase/invertase (TIGR01784 family)
MRRFDEYDDPIDICLDNVFKAVFTRESPQSRKALSALLSAFIGQDLEVITITTNEPPIDNLRDRQIRFDIPCKTGGGELINVEMSLNPDVHEPARLEFYAAKLFTSQDIHGKDRSYKDLQEAYQVAILGKGRFFADGEFLHQFEYYDPERGLSLGGKSRIITVELSKLDGVIEKPVGAMTAPERWGIFFRYVTDRGKRRTINEIVKREEGIEMASDVLIKISRDEVERARLLSEYKYVLDTQSKLATAREEGRNEAAAEYAEQIQQTQEQNRQIQEQNRQAQEQIRRLEEENRRLREGR